jgi:hypothetical protein
VLLLATSLVPYYRLLHTALVRWLSVLVFAISWCVYFFLSCFCCCFEHTVNTSVCCRIVQFFVFCQCPFGVILGLFDAVARPHAYFGHCLGQSLSQ